MSVPCSVTQVAHEDLHKVFNSRAVVPPTLIVPGEHPGCPDLHLILLKHSDAQRQSKNCKVETG